MHVKHALPSLYVVFILSGAAAGLRWPLSLCLLDSLALQIEIKILGGFAYVFAIATEFQNECQDPVSVEHSKAHCLGLSSTKRKKPLD